MRTIVVGEALVDLVQGPDGRFSAHAGGSPFNVAVTLGRLGANVAMAGASGADPFGDLLTTRLADAHVHLDLWRRSTRPTSLALAVPDAQGRAAYSFYFDGTAGLSFPQLTTDADVLHAGSIASWTPPAAETVAAAMSRARGNGRTLLTYDVNARPALMPDVDDVRRRIEKCCVTAHVVKVSDEDIEFLYPGVGVGSVASRWCAMGADLAVVTRGVAGVDAYSAQGLVATQAAPQVAVADTVGAGDSFMGGLLSAFGGLGLAEPEALGDAVRARDRRIDDALASAVMVAAITCERPGADPPTAAELATRLS